MNLFGFKSKKGEVLNHWFAPIDGFSYPPLDFYATVEKELAARKIPSMDISRVEFAEGGVLSDKRIYLRMIRERLTFDICAAPFGRYFFFSCRSVYIPAVVEFWHVLVLFLFFGLLDYLLSTFLGSTFALIAIAALILAVAQVFRNTIALGLSDLDATLMKLPIIGPVYERWFRKDTYYRQDTRLVYLQVVSKLIQELAEELCAAKGVKLVNQYQTAPVLGDLYRPLPTTTPPSV